MSLPLWLPNLKSETAEAGVSMTKKYWKIVFDIKQTINRNKIVAKYSARVSRTRSFSLDLQLFQCVGVVFIPKGFRTSSRKNRIAIHSSSSYQIAIDSPNRQQNSNNICNVQFVLHNINSAICRLDFDLNLFPWVCSILLEKPWVLSFFSIP